MKSSLLLERHVEAPVSMQISVPPTAQKSMDLSVVGSVDWKAQSGERHSLFSCVVRVEWWLKCGIICRFWSRRVGSMDSILVGVVMCCKKIAAMEINIFHLVWLIAK